MVPEGRKAAVIGAGIVGTCCALYLQRDGWQVTLIDPREPGEACSFGNAGLIATSAVPPIARPGLLRRVPAMLIDPLGPFAVRWSYVPRAAPWLWRFIRAGTPRRVETITAELASLTCQVEEAYEPLIKSAGAGELIYRRGALLVHETEAELRFARVDRALRQRHGGYAEAVSADEIRQIEPALAPIFKGGTYRPDVNSVASPVRLTRAFAADFFRKGGSMIRAEARGIVVKEPGRRQVVTGESPVEAELVVVAAGAWSKALARLLGAKLPLDTERGYHVMLQDAGLDLRIPVGSEARGFYCTPMADGLRVAGTVELAGLDAPPNYARAEILLKHAARFYPGLRTAPVERWMGPRPSFPDSKPVISGLKGEPGVLLAFGHGHIGLTLAAVTGRAVADMAADRPTVADMTPFRADRF